MKRLTALALLAATAACGSNETGQPAAAASEPAAAAASEAAAPEPATASPAAQAAASAPFAAKPDQSLNVVSQAECFEVGAGADDSPWTMYPGVTVTYVGEQDGKAKVRGISGKECLIAWDALAPS